MAATNLGSALFPGAHSRTLFLRAIGNKMGAHQYLYLDILR